MRWRRKNSQSRLDRAHLQERDAAFQEAHAALAKRLAGQPEERVRAAMQRLLDEHGVRLSGTEAELWTLEVVDPAWAEKDPTRARELLLQLSDGSAGG